MPDLSAPQANPMSKSSQRVKMNKRLQRQKHVNQSPHHQETKSPSRLLHERLSHVEAEQERLGKAFDQNSEVFTDSFRMLEGMTAVMQRVLFEITTQGKPTIRHPDESPDFMGYLREYWLCMTLADFAAWANRLQPPEEVVPLVAQATQNDPIIFGG